VIRETGKQLAELTQRAMDRNPPALEPTEKGLGAVKELGEQMAKLQLNRTDALRELASVTEKLKDQTKELGKNPAIRKLEQAARSQTGQSPASNADLQKQIDSMQKQLGNPNANSDALDKLQKELQKMQQAAAGMSANDSAAQQQKEQLSQALAELSKKADELGLSLPSLNEAIKALEAGEIDQFLKDLKFAETDLQKMQAMAKAIQDLEKQMAKLGKDLAEQLEKGQASAAQSTLQKMIDELKSANLSAEQLSKMLAEVDKAVKPGSQYGKVGEFLKDAVGKMQQGEKSGAAKSLADASAELKRLMDQLGDAQSLMATMDALQKAQMCVGNSMGWAQCNRPGFNPNGKKPGSGVGTWSDDNGWNTDFVEMTDRWDNSNVNRPDMNSRGMTDRGDGTLSDALVPTKVKGQISPGGPMPSITLKGVSIKGTSKVAYQEAVAAAQSSAQSALSQEQVPRAYQGAVRDYFDDLKE
jgi:chemotaxis protein histidine kinase CheA